MSESTSNEEVINADATGCPHDNLSPAGSEQIKLWTPDPVGLWSLVLSPIWGAVLISKNWKALGEAHKAKRAMLWCYVNIVLLLAIMIADLPCLLSAVYLIIWYFFSLRRQKKYIAEKGIFYQRKSWKTPLLIGFAALILWFLFCFGVGVIMACVNE